MPTATLPGDPAEDLLDAQEQAGLLREAFASREPKYITAALGAVARARGMSGPRNGPALAAPRSIGR